MRLPSLCGAPLLAILLAAPDVVAQRSGTSASPADTPREAVRQLRTMYFGLDSGRGSQAAAGLIRSYPGTPELRAWAIAHRAARGPADAPLAAADSLVRAFPRSPWGHFARARALAELEFRDGEARAAARQARELAPRNPDVLWLNVWVLQRGGRANEAVALADSAIALVGATPELLVVKANAVHAQSFGRKGDPKKVEEATALAEAALKTHPDDVGLLYAAAQLLSRQRRSDEAYALLKRAAKLAPTSETIHSSYWYTLNGLPGRSAEEKKAEILADVEALLKLRGDDPRTLRTVADVYGDLKLADQQRELQERVLRDFPDSYAAELVLVDRHRALAKAMREKQVPDSASAEREYRAQLRAYLDRPVHHSKPYLGEVYLDYFFVLRNDSTASVDELREVVEGMAKYNLINPHLTHIEGPIALAERKAHFRTAERIAREGQDVLRKYLSRPGYAISFETVGDFADAMDGAQSMAHDALGWVYFNEGRLNEAEKELTRALELSRRNGSVFYHLGQLAEKRGDVEKAEELYAQGYGPEHTRLGGGKKNSAALERLYRARHGSTDGFDDYIERIMERDRAKRREKIAASRIADPKLAPAFVLESLDGGKVSSDALHGKITVINFWGMWCGPCVAEIGDIQKFHEKYRNDPDVQFLSVDYNDRDLDALRAWMKKKGLDFPVLLDDGFVTKAGVNAYPTTWFLDRAGRIAFRHSGASNAVLEEFIWRVELLKEGMQGAQTTTP